ncbi:MAG: glycosyltransferase family 2 protein [Sedimentisphaerales bacterium]|nr:glycosyltransferase family 2 protein [Sedimentisphaerales bacterium]
MTELLYSVVVPVYRSAAMLDALYERIERTFSQLEGDFELILVEDGGNDDCWEVMRSLRNRDARVKIVRLTRNFGQHSALMCGFGFAQGDYVITIDDDLQNPPEELSVLIAAIQGDNLDVIFGIPRQKKHSFFRKLASSLFGRIISLTYPCMKNLRLSNVQIIRRKIVERILEIKTPNPLVALLLLEVTGRVGNVRIEHHQGAREATTYSRVKLIRSFTNGIFYHSLLPLKGVFILGMGSFVLSVLLGLIYFILFCAGLITVSGWTTIVLLILLFSGLIMISLGIVGEYLFRVIQEVYRGPQYIIRDKEI